MKRSTKEVMYVTPRDFSLVSMGLKTATTRLGDRRELWPTGHKFQIVDNVNGHSLGAIVTYNVQKRLRGVTRAEAGTVGGGYSTEAHYNDFVGVYEGSRWDTEISLVGFKVEA